MRYEFKMLFIKALNLKICWQIRFVLTGDECYSSHMCLDDGINSYTSTSITHYTLMNDEVTQM